MRLGIAGWHSRGYLPHFSDAVHTQFVTFRLFDSMPQEVLQRWAKELEQFPKSHLEREQKKRIEAYLDSGYGSCYLRDSRIAEVVQNALLHFDHDRYALHAWVIMPNHVHVLFTPLNAWEWGKILHSWKSFTAHECNKILERQGELWQKDPFDRYIRDEQHFANARAYIENNPVKAGLCATPQDWQWSSAHYRS
ncbi:MAG: transposase [Acidobacteria bacterium]|nr:transposase [Acidobacteriota bacterium]